MARWREPSENEKRQQKMKVKHVVTQDMKMSRFMLSVQGVIERQSPVEELNANGSVPYDRKNQ